MSSENPPPTAEAPKEVPEMDQAEKAAEDTEARRWYNHGECYVTLEEFRAEPMGKDILGGGEGSEELLLDRFSKMPTEAEHRALGGQWDLKEMANPDKPWEFLTAFEKVETVVGGIVKFFCIWGVLYMFIISLGIMGNAFKILGGRTSGRAFRDSDLLANPVSGMAIGILATVLMQSSSTTTSIVISMAAADLVSVENAAYLVMGANIGTSVTNTIVSIAHLNSQEEYRRAFTGSVFHDMFNWLTVGIFLPLEWSSGFLMELAGAAVDSLGISDDTEKRNKVVFIKKITSPASGRVVSTDKKLIEKIAAAETSEEVKKLEKKTIIKQKSGHVLRDSPISDDEAGVLMLFVSLTMLATCLLMLVKLLQSVLKGRVAIWTRYLLNINFTHPVLRACGGMDNYLLLLFGTGCTILVQSSSVFTSTLTPLIGMGLIHIEKAVALTHGANIGTTVTGVLSALSGSNVDKGMRVALEHVFFNSLGTILWFCVWPLRVVPLNMAKFLGGAAANLRWFPLAYIVTVFLVLPLLVVGLAIPGWEVLCGVMTPIVIAVLLLVVWVFLRRNRADLLPRSMGFLRADKAVCGCAYPNFMQLWGGDLEKDAVDLNALREKEEKRKADMLKVKDWPYSPAAWGLAIMAFVGAVISVPTGQWRRVRYAQEGRAEIGYGLWDTCSSLYKDENHWAVQPDRVCDATLLEECAAELSGACAGESAWASSAPGTSNEEALYTKAWERCSKLGCRMHAWRTHCPNLSSCKGRAAHETLCAVPSAKYVFYGHTNMDADEDTVYTYAEPAGTRVPETLPFDLFKYTKEPSSSAKSEEFTLSKPLSGVAYDPCTGHLHGITARGCDSSSAWAPAVQKFTLSETLKKETSANVFRELNLTTVTGVNGLPNTAGGTYGTHESCGARRVSTVGHAAGASFGDVAILDAGKGLYMGSEEYGPKIVVWGPAGVVATYAPAHLAGAGKRYPTAIGVLPEIFALRAERRGLKGLAVQKGGERAVTCMASPLTGSEASLKYSRVVRCAILDISDPASPKLDAQKVVLLPHHGTDAQAEVKLAGLTFLSSSEDKVAALVTVTFDGTTTAKLYQLNFEKATDVREMAEFNDLTVDAATGVRGLALERSIVDAANKRSSLNALQTVVELGVKPAELREVMDFADASVESANLASVAALTDYSVVVTEDGTSPKAYVVQMSKGTDLDAKLPSCKKTATKTWEAGDKCRKVSDVCQGLSGDLEKVGGLVVTASLFVGIGTVAIVLYSFFPHHAVIGKFIFVSAATLFLGWVLLLSSWAHVLTMEKSKYTCMFEDEALRGGLVLVTGKLSKITMQSYSWAFAIYAWGLLTLALLFVIPHTVSVIINPPKPPVDEDAAVAENEPIAEA